MLFLFPIRCGDCLERAYVNLFTAFKIYRESHARRAARKNRRASAAPHTKTNGA
jgi:hypothetical protein